MKINTKYLLYFLFLSLIIISCNDDSNSYTINGQIQGLTDPSDLYLVTSNDSVTHIDTLQAVNGKFKFKGNSNIPQPIIIYMENGSVWFTIWVQNNEKISITGDVNYPELIQVKGGEINNLLTEFKNSNKESIKERGELRDKIISNSKHLDELSTELNEVQFTSQIKNIDQILKNKAEDFVEAHPTSIASLILIQDYILDFENSSAIEPYLALISEEAKETNLYQKLKDFSIKDQQTRTGSKAPDFNVIDIKNDTITLGTFREKYLLLTFAASWCTFCEPDYQDLITIKKNFSKNDLDILTISLDENKEDWEELAKRKEITWTQVNDNAGWASDMVSLYNVSEIPCNYLIDKEGKIVASKLSLDSISSILTEQLKKM